MVSSEHSSYLVIGFRIMPQDVGRELLAFNEEEMCVTINSSLWPVIQRSEFLMSCRIMTYRNSRHSKVSK